MKQLWKDRFSGDKKTLLIRAVWLVALLLAITLQSCYFAVPEGGSAVVTRFGRPIRELTEAGPYWKLPWPIDEVRELDMRLRLFNTPYTATLTRDKKSVVLHSFVVWRVVHPLLFIQTVGALENGDRKLEGMVLAAKGFHVGQFDLSALVSMDPKEIKTEEIERRILSEVKEKAARVMGIDVVEFGFKRIAFPEENTPAVISHMRAERSAEAGRLRAEGEREAQAIRNEAIVRSEGILREGKEKAGRILGEGEREAARLYAQSEAQDPAFYRFWRSLETAKKILGSNQSTIILRTDQSPFNALGEEKP